MTIDQSLAAQDIMEDIKNRKYNPLNDGNSSAVSKII